VNFDWKNQTLQRQTGKIQLLSFYWTQNVIAGMQPLAVRVGNLGYFADRFFLC